MSRNGAGVYVRIAGTPYVYDTVIDEVVVNAEMDDIAAALTASLAKDGQTTPTANLPMGGYRHTGVANATARNNYAAAGQVQDSSFTWCGTAGGSANSFTLSPSPAITAYDAGQEFQFIAVGTNTGTVQVNVSSVGAKDVQLGGSAIASGEIVSGRLYGIRYDGTQFQLLHAILIDGSVTAAKLADGSVTAAKFASGAIEGAMPSASQAEMQTGTEAALRLMSPLRVAQAITALSTPVSFASTSEVAGTHTTGSITSGAAALTVASGTGISNGDYVVGEGITPGTTVSSGGGGTSLTLSANANATLSSDPVAFYKPTKALSPASTGGMLCRAWVNFNGSGTVAIRASFNVKSITDHATGQYSINFTSALTDANYSVVASHSSVGGDTSSVQIQANTAAAARLHTTIFGGLTDPTSVFAAVFR